MTGALKDTQQTENREMSQTQDFNIVDEVEPPAKKVKLEANDWKDVWAQASVTQKMQIDKHTYNKFCQEKNMLKDGVCQCFIYDSD